LPFDARVRDQIKLKVLPSSSANRLAKIGAFQSPQASVMAGGQTVQPVLDITTAPAYLVAADDDGAGAFVLPNKPVE
jgi:hypothetical protein